ncbi:MAG TPA: sigma-70 family RNA polymerase sigma factor [Phycisphaerae bacterium]|nr:sigma-70 family RNA polymerase sigma factor [Phycisphaerae bacterium]
MAACAVGSARPDPAKHLDVVYRAVAHLARNLPWLYDDLVQEGSIGLCKAARRYDASRGVEFPAYAWPRVCGAIRDALRQVDPLTRHARRKLRGTDQQGESFTCSLDALGHGADDPFGNTLPAPEPGPDELAERQISFDRLRAARAKLPRRWDQVLTGCFDRELRQKDVAREMGMHESWVSQIRTQALARLRAAL